MAATIKFTVRRRPAVLVAPASPTPHELKRLSDFDDQDSLRLQIPNIHFYKRKKDNNQDPAAVIRDAIARALVPYYPFAGRVREHDSGKLAVDCTGEGVLFVEADADVRLEQFGDPLLPPFPCLEELLFDIPGSSAIIDTPLLLIQVTRLACGGFIMAVRLNHTMADAQGLTQFLGVVAELARGDDSTIIRQPVWERHLLEGRHNSLQPRDDESLDDDVTDDSSSSMLPLLSQDNLVVRSFFFGPGEIAAIRAQLSSSPELQKKCPTSRFDIIAGWLWKYRTMALAPPDPSEPMLLIVVVNARGPSGLPPPGYYGNAFAIPAAVSTAGELCWNPVGYAVGLIKQAKAKVVDMDYMRSEADLLVLHRGRLLRFPAGLYSLSDVTRAGFDHMDLGWGRPVYGGPAEAVGTPALPWTSSFILPIKNADGEDIAVVPVCLPHPAMDRLVDEMGKLRWRQREPVADMATLQQPRGGHDGFPAVVVKRSAL